MRRTRHDLIKGIGITPILRRAARELDVLGRRNARIAEVDGRAHTYDAIVDLYYLTRQRADGVWEAQSVEALAGTVLKAARAESDNILPALTMAAIEALVRGGAFNEFEPAKRFVLDGCRFIHAGKVEVFPCLS